MWWRSYRDLSLLHTRLAKSTGTENLRIGAERINVPTELPDEWRGVIPAIPLPHIHMSIQ